MDELVFKTVTAIIAVVGIFLAWYRIYVTRPIDKTKKELASLDYQIKKHESELNRENPDLEFSFEINKHSNANGHVLNINTTCTNRGRRVAECVVHPELLTIAKVIWNGDRMEFGNHKYATFHKLENGENKHWNINAIYPEAKKTYPFCVQVEEEGIYYIQVKIKMSEKNEKLFRASMSQLSHDPIYWSGSVYYFV